MSGIHHPTKFVIEPTFFKDGRLAISNNLRESHIRPFATARRAWLFADTPKGAVANAILYTIVETARGNQLNIYEYLKYLLNVIPNTDDKNYTEQLVSVMGKRTTRSM